MASTLTAFLGTQKQIAFAAVSVALGAWAFKAVNEISGPGFEPIVKVCTDSSISAQEFADKTGYQPYEPLVGFGVFNFLVCLITQFLYELRNTYPAGLLVWGGVVVVSLPFSVLATIEAGRVGSKGLIRYPLILGLLYQLFGISVMVPLLWVPAYIYGHGNGGVSTMRAFLSVPLGLPALILTALVFTADTKSYLWTLSAGTLGGPGLPLVAAVLWGDKPPSTKEQATAGQKATVTAYRMTLLPALIFYLCLVYVAVSTYGMDAVSLWKDIWTEAGPSVGFMTIDTGILYVAVLWYIAYRSYQSALKAMALTPFLGPGAAFCLVMAEMEQAMKFDEDVKQD